MSNAEKPALVSAQGARGKPASLLEELRSGAFATRCFAPVDIASLAVFRIAFGLLMLWDVADYLRHDWVHLLFIDPVYHFTYYGFEWVKPWPGDGMVIQFWVLAVAAVFIAAGFCYRFAAAIFFLGFTHAFLIDATEFLNHIYLICLVSFLMIFLPAHRAWSLDAWRKPALRSDAAPAWALWLLRAQIGIPYFFGGVAKLNADWLQGDPMRLWLANRTNYPVIGRWFTEEWMVYFFTYSGLILDLSIVPLLLWRRTRLGAYFLVLCFNFLNMSLFKIGIFPWLMIGASLIFFPPDWPRFGRVRGPVAPGAGAAPLTEKQKWTLGLGAAYLAVQLLVPMRHVVYPGYVNWTDEGFLFSWRMKLRDKEAVALFSVTDRATLKSWYVAINDYLTPRQLGLMPGRADFVHQFALHLADGYRKQGHSQIEVRALVTVKLNAREPETLIDPEVDLAAEPRNLRHKRWIMPLTKPLPAPGSRRNSPPAAEE